MSRWGAGLAHSPPRYDPGADREAQDRAAIARDPRGDARRVPDETSVRQEADDPGFGQHDRSAGDGDESIQHFGSDPPALAKAGAGLFDVSGIAPSAPNPDQDRRS